MTVKKHWSGVEEWRPIQGFEGFEASTAGRIRSNSPYLAEEGGIVSTPKGHKYLQAGVIPTGSPKKRVSGHRWVVTRRVHILVALAFLGPKPTPEHEVNHINGDKMDNRPDNLEYITSFENEMHAKGWLKARGNNHGARFRKLMVELVDWFDAPEVQGAFAFTATRFPGGVSPEFSRRAGRLWDAAHALVDGSPEKKQRDEALTDGNASEEASK